MANAKSHDRSASDPRRRGRLQDAKARFSEVVRLARESGPQRVTLHWRDAVVVVSADVWDREPRRHSGQRLVSALAAWIDATLRPLFEGRTMSISEDVILRWRLLVEMGRRRGHIFAQPDLFIAAIAAEEDFIVVSCATVHFEAAGILVLDPWSSKFHSAAGVVQNRGKITIVPSPAAGLVGTRISSFGPYATTVAAPGKLPWERSSRSDATVRAESAQRRTSSRPP